MADENEHNEEVSYVNPDSTFGDMSKAPEGVRDFVAKKGFKSLEEQTAAHIELEGMLGQRDRMIVIPESRDDKEGWGKVYDKLGRPAKAEDYKFEVREGDPPAPDSLITLFKEYAYGKGYNQADFQDTINFQMDAHLASLKIMEETEAEKRGEDQKAIRGRFDTEDAYNKFTQDGMAFAEKFKLDDKNVMDVLVDKGLAHDPVVLNMLSTLNSMTKEDSLPNGGKRLDTGREDRIKEIQKDPAFTTALHVDHEKIMTEYNALFRTKPVKEG